MIRTLFSVVACMTVAGPAVAQDAFDRPYWLDRSVIEALGRAQVVVSPDEASFSVTFREVAGDARAALFAASDRARLADAAIRSRGGDAIRIQSDTSVQGIFREYRNDAGERVSSERADQIENYAASVTLDITVTDLARAENVRAAALAVGPESVSDLAYGLSETATARTRAYRAAVQDAAARARIAAEASGAPLGRLLVLQEGQGPCVGRWVGMGSRAQREAHEAISPITTVGAEQIEVTASNRRLRLSAEDIARMRLPSDVEPIEVSSAVCAIYAVG
jgi:uncharacterized protein YggE